MNDLLSYKIYKKTKKVTKKGEIFDLVCDQYIGQCLQIGFKLRVNKLGFKP
jgi:hypothetical protein